MTFLCVISYPTFSDHFFVPHFSFLFLLSTFSSPPFRPGAARMRRAPTRGAERLSKAGDRRRKPHCQTRFGATHCERRRQGIFYFWGFVCRWGWGGVVCRGRRREGQRFLLICFVFSVTCILGCCYFLLFVLSPSPPSFLFILCLILAPFYYPSHTFHVKLCLSTLPFLPGLT
jgi:hypothetical protein